MTSYFIDNEGIYSSNCKTYIVKEHPSCLPDAPLNWLLTDNPKENKLLYDLDACVASLIHMTMNEQQARELHDNEKVHIGFCKVTYFPNRFFAIDGYRNFVNFGNMMRYRSDTHYSPNDTIEDKINKAKECEEIAVGAREVLKSLYLNPEKIISPVSAIIEKYIKPLAIPTVDDYPEDIGEIAYRTIKGNWNEAYQMGYWDEAYDQDLNGAYGSRLEKLLDIRRGKWVESTAIPTEAHYGFAEGTLNTMANFHPYLVKVNEDFSYTPTGSRLDQLPLSLIRLLHKHHLGSFDIKRGYWWIPSETKPKYEPLKGIVNHLWNIRSKSEGLKKAIIRQMLAGIWGRMTEIRKDEFGDLFNPVWGSIVENDVKYIVSDTCLSYGVTPLQIAVDGALTDKPLPIQDTRTLGEWRLSHKGRCIIASSGVVGMEGKDGAEEFALKFEWLYEKLKNNPDKSEYSMDKYSPITLGKALKNNKFEDLGKLEKTTRSILIGKDFKRMWRKYPTTGGELLSNHYDSSPLDITMAQLPQ